LKKESSKEKARLEAKREAVALLLKGGFVRFIQAGEQGEFYRVIHTVTSQDLYPDPAPVPPPPPPPPPPPAKHCAKCGLTHPASFNYCSNCGKKL